MKKRMRWMLTGILLLLLTACSDAGEGQEKLTQAPVLTGEAGLEQSSAASGEVGLEQSSASTGEDGTAQTPVPTEAEVLSGLSRPVGEGGTAVSLQGAVLENLTVVGEDNEYYCNLEANVKRQSANSLEYPVLVCKDPVYDITYYVNYGRDYFIYAKRGDVTQKVLEIPGKDLFCRQGILYFSTDTYDQYKFDSFVDGAVLAYNPADGSVEVVIDKPVEEMVVYPDGILYFEREISIAEDGTEESGGLWRHYYSFEYGETEERSSQLKTLARWKENSLVMEFVEENGRDKIFYKLETPEGEQVKEFTSLTEALESRRKSEASQCMLHLYCIQGDCIYYLDADDRLLCYDMVTEKETVIVELGAEIGFESKSFVILDDAAYFGNAIKYSFEEDKQYAISLQGMGRATIRNLYTDGESVYVLANEKLWLYEETELSEEGSATDLMIPGREIIMGRYGGILHPLGE